QICETFPRLKGLCLELLYNTLILEFVFVAVLLYLFASSAIWRPGPLLFVSQAWQAYVLELWRFRSVAATFTYWSMWRAFRVSLITLLIGPGGTGPPDVPFLVAVDVTGTNSVNVRFQEPEQQDSALCTKFKDNFTIMIIHDPFV
ncbi:Uncharacterized protein GBIM_19349, partial [Gryllus bimaculatus]